MINWDREKEERLAELVQDEARHSEYKIADIMTSEFGERISRDAVHNKMRRLGVSLGVAKQPKILLFDIETTPNVSYTWGLFKQDVGLNQVIKPAFMLCWAGKWLFDDKVMSDCISPSDAVCGNDESISRSLWDVIDEADIVVAHNGDKFDIPWANSRFVYHGMVPPSPYRTIDTLKVCRQTFYFTSNKLEWVSKYLTKEEKIKTSFELWARCMNGEEDALKRMSEYNVQDTAMLEEVYVKLRPWIRNHPNLGLYYDTEAAVCGHCGSSNLISMTKPYVTNARTYETFRCIDCGAVNRVKKSTSTTRLRTLAR